jgi:trk system potassium uptake protein TrkA
MHIVIAGAGAVGQQIAQQLIAENKDVALIESDEERVKSVTNQIDCLVIHGSASSLENLLKAGIAKADFFICVTNSDEVNMISAGIVTSMFHLPKVISRIRNTEYQTNSILMGKFLDIDYVVNPEKEAAKEIIDITQHGATSHIITFKKSDVNLINLDISSDSALINRPLKEIRKEYEGKFLVSAILRNESIIIPDGDSVIEPNDNVYVQTNQNDIQSLFNTDLHGKNDKLKKILIVGGTRLGRQVMGQLIKIKYSVTMIDKNYEKCKQLSDEFPHALILRGDVTDENIYEDENIADFDLILCMTNNEELNLITALYAKKIGTKRAIALVINNNYFKLANQLGIDSVVSPKSSSVDSILKFIRKGNVSSIKSIFNGLAEILEFTITTNHPLLNKTLKKKPLPANSLLLSINRAGRKIIPDGEYTYREGDAVLVIAKKNVIPKIEKMYSSPVYES